MATHRQHAAPTLSNVQASAPRATLPHRIGEPDRHPLAVAAIHRLHQTHGNQAVQRLLRRQRGGQAATSPIHRYTVVDFRQGGQQQYTTQPATPATKPFASQRVDYTHKYDKEPASGRNRVTQTLTSVNFSSDTPPLRVADTGDMAIEHGAVDGSEQKVFYARPNLIRASQERLEDVGSTVTLDLQGSTITVPANPQAPVPGQTKLLNMVVPRQVGAAKGTAFQGRTSICSKFADDIMGKTDKRVNKEDATAIFQPAGSSQQTTTPLNYKSAAEKASPFQVVGAIAGGVTSPAALLGQLGDKDQSVDGGAKNELVGLLTKHNVRMIEQAINTYAARSTPQQARDEIKLRVKKGQPITGTMVDTIIDKYAMVPAVKTYANMSGAPLANATSGLGVNEYAMPDVGEAFGGMSIGGGGIAKVETVGKHANVVGNVDYRGLSAKQSRKLDPLLDPAKSAKIELAAEVMPLAKELYDHVKTGIWNWHFASVVAKSGNDVVTLENYNRAQGDRIEAENRNAQLWAQLQVSFRELLEQNKALRKAVGKEPDAAKKIDLLVDAAANDFGGNLRIFALAIAKAMPPEMTRWFFQMYGPANKAQSFHDAWAKDPQGDFVNPLTLRFGEAASQEYKDSMSEKLLAKVETLYAHKAGKTPHDRTGNLAYLSTLTDVVTDVVANITAAPTKTQVSKAYRDGLSALSAIGDSI